MERWSPALHRISRQVGSSSQTAIRGICVLAPGPRYLLLLCLIAAVALTGALVLGGTPNQTQAVVSAAGPAVGPQGLADCRQLKDIAWSRYAQQPPPADKVIAHGKYFIMNNPNGPAGSTVTVTLNIPDIICNNKAFNTYFSVESSPYWDWSIKLFRWGDETSDVVAGTEPPEPPSGPVKLSLQATWQPTTTVSMFQVKGIAYPRFADGSTEKTFSRSFPPQYPLIRAYFSTGSMPLFAWFTWSAASMSVDPGSLDIYSNPGPRPQSTTVLTVTNHSSNAITWNASRGTSSGGNWLSVSPTSGYLATGQSAQFSASIDSRTLITGTYEGWIAVTSPQVPTSITATVHMTNIERPLIFIPGIAGSTILDTAHGNDRLWPSLLDSAQQKMSLYQGQIVNGLVAGDAIRSAYDWTPASTEVYRPLLSMLVSNGYPEYVVNDLPARRTAADCDLAQRGNNPKLFVYAYDWRKTNVESAGGVKEYVGCIERLYPGTQVNILTHSMGGLVARRYILDNPTDNQVDDLVTMAAPWLGAPKVVNVLETGDFIININKNTMKNLVGAWLGPQQLLPTRSYFALGGTPMGQKNWDVAQDGIGTEMYDYNTYVRVVDSRYGRQDGTSTSFFRPGTADSEFHDYRTARGGQDDWRNDSTGVNYFHIVGQQSTEKTIGSVTLTCKVFTNNNAGSNSCYADTARVLGDETVPILSLTRMTGTLNLNAPGYFLRVMTTPKDSLVEHTGITKNPEVHTMIRSILMLSNQPRAQSEQTMAALAEDPPPFTPSPIYDMKMFGVDRVVVSDGLGNSTDYITGTLRGTVTDVLSLSLGPGVEEVLLPTSGTLTVTFQTITGALGIDLNLGTTQTATQVIRYVDQGLPISTTAILRFTSEGVDSLRYDVDGDGIFESVLSPTVAVSGTVSLDIEPPDLVISGTVLGPSTVLVTVTATDTGSGLGQVRYSLDGQQYQAYTGTLLLNPSLTPVVYAFADDNMANRSSLVTYALAKAGCCDYNGNGWTDVGDLERIAAQWGAANLTYDYSGDGGVGLGDLNYAAHRWRQGPANSSNAAIQGLTPTLSLLVSPDTHGVTSTIDVQVVLTNATGAGAFEFDLGFDPSRLQVISMTVASSLGSEGICDPGAGRCAIALGPGDGTTTSAVGAFTYGTGGGMNGSGLIATIRLRGLGTTGPAALEIRNALAADTSGVLSTPTTQGATISLGSYNVYLPAVLRSYVGAW